MERLNEKDKEFRFGDWGPKYITRGPNLEWGIILLKVGNSLGKHKHERAEEIFYFLEGKADIEVEGKVYPVGCGDVVRIEPQEAHDIKNVTEELRAVFIKSPYLPEDKISLE